MSYVAFGTLLLIATSGVISFYRQLKILQKNSYSLPGYFKWVITSYTTGFALSTILYCALTIAIKKEMEILPLVLAAVLMLVRVAIFVIANKNSTKKLMFDSRVKAFYVTAILMLGVLVVIATISTNATAVNICRMVCLLLSIIMPVLTCVVWFVTLPIAKFLSKKTPKEPETNDGATD